MREPPAAPAVSEPPKGNHRHSSRDRDRERRRHHGEHHGSKPARRSRSRSTHRRSSDQPAPRQRHHEQARSPGAARVSSGAGERESKGTERRGRESDDKRREVSKIRELVERLYIKQNPSKLADVDGLFDKYRGAEREMYLRICTIYKVQPDPSVIAAPGEAYPARRVPSKSRSPAARPKPLKPVAKSAAVRAAVSARTIKDPSADDLDAKRIPQGSSHEVSRRQRNSSRSPRASSTQAHRRPQSSNHVRREAEASHQTVAEGAPEEVDPHGVFCSKSDCGMQLCAGVNFETHPITKRMYCYDCWFTGGIYLEVSGGRREDAPAGRERRGSRQGRSGSRGRRQAAEETHEKNGRQKHPPDQRAARAGSRDASDGGAAGTTRGASSRGAASPSRLGVNGHQQPASAAEDGAGRDELSRETADRAEAPPLEGVASQLPGDLHEATTSTRASRSRSPVRSDQ